MSKERMSREVCRVMNCRETSKCPQDSCNKECVVCKSHCPCCRGPENECCNDCNDITCPNRIESEDN